MNRPDDIAPHLRAIASRGHTTDEDNFWLFDVADEIERLRVENTDLRGWVRDGALYDVYLELHEMVKNLVEALRAEATWYCCGDSFFGPCDCPPDTVKAPEFRSGLAGLYYGLAVALLDRLKEPW